MGYYVRDHGVKNLQKYKYSGVDLSFTSKYIFQPFWSKFVLILPTWIAPNLVTLLGFFFLTFSCFLSFYFSPDLKTPSPNWVYTLHGLNLFLYQTFDAVDGKQARRTGASSPLGELFDHGCDALACSLEALTFSSVVLQGHHVIWPWVLATAAFYFATWETFHTHTLLLNVVNGPTEGLLIMYLAEFWTGIVGSQWWLQDFRSALLLPSNFLPFLPKIPMNYFSIGTFVPGLAITVLSTVFNVRRTLRSRGAAKQIYSPLSLLVPYLALVGLQVAWTYLSPTAVMERFPFLAIAGVGFAFALLVGRLILGHLCDEYEGLLEALWMPLLVLPLGVGNALLGQLSSAFYVDELWLLLLHVVYNGGMYAHFVYGVIHDICVARNIYCLRLGSRVDPSKSKES